LRSWRLVRLWFHKWRETRPDQPYVDVELKPYPHKDGRIRFTSRVYANVAEGILREHLAEIADLLKRRGVEGVAYYDHGRKGAYLRFTGAFRDSVLGRLSIRPELPLGEPPEVKHLGGLKFKIGDREVEFERKIVSGRHEFYAVLKFPPGKEAENFAKSLKAIGVDAEVVGSEKAGYTVRLDSDAFFGLLAATNAEPPGLTPLYSSKEGDFRVYASAEGGGMRFYFAVRHKGVWRETEEQYEEKANSIRLIRAERDVLEAIRDAVVKALKKLGRSAKVEEPKEDRDEEGNIKAYYLKLYGPHLAAFLEHAAERVEVKPAEVRLEGGRIVINAGGVETAVEFKLLKRGEAKFLTAQDVGQTLALYKSLKALGVPVEITPKGVKINSEALRALVATAVERGTPGKLPAEVMPGVELLKVYSTGGVEMYIFRAEGDHYYFAVKTREGWRAAGGKYDSRQMRIFGKAASAVAEAINAIYSEMGVERRVEVKYDKRKGTPYIKLTNVDLKLLGVK